MIFWNIIALIRALIVFTTMPLWLMAYSFSLLFQKHTPQAAFDLRRSWLRFIAYPVLGLRVEKIGNPIDSPALYVSNHRSFSDPLVLCRFLDAYVVAKAEVANYPIINVGAKVTGVLFVQRSDRNSRQEVRSKVSQTILSGFNVLVYPEGTVGIDPETLPFRVGSFVEAAANGIPVVPVAIEYGSTRDLWIYPHFIRQYFHQFSKGLTPVKLYFGEPIIGTDGEQIKNQAFQVINAKLAEFQKEFAKK